MNNPMIFVLKKSYVSAHDRKSKNGKVTHIVAHYDKRTKKGQEHAPDHGHDVQHLSSADRDKFNRMHQEQHMLHHYHAHALKKRIAEHEASIKEAHTIAMTHREKGEHVQAAKEANKGLSLHAKLLEHKKELEEIQAKIDGIGKMKESFVAGSGAVSDSSDATHDVYAAKIGSRWKVKKPKEKVYKDIFENPETYKDEAIATLARKAAFEYFHTKRDTLPESMSLGDFKRATLNGQYPQIVREAYDAQQAEISKANKKKQDGIAAVTGLSIPGYKFSIEGSDIIVSGQFQDAIHAKIKKLGGYWDGNLHKNRRVWVLPVEKGKSLAKFFSTPDTQADIELEKHFINQKKLAEQKQSAERWVGYIEDHAERGSLYSNGLEAIQALPMSEWPDLQERVQKAKDKVAAKKADEAAKKAADALKVKNYLDVPYSEKDFAKQHGARWDNIARSWYVLGDVPEALSKFNPSNAASKTADVSTDQKITYLNVPYEEKDIAKRAGARWDARENSWYMIGDVPEKLKKYERKVNEGEVVFHIGSGYHGNFHTKVGDVIRNPKGKYPEFLYVTNVSKKYYKEDGMSFGVGDDSGYIYTITGRQATHSELEPYLLQEAQLGIVDVSFKKLKAVSSYIEKNGEYHEKVDNIEGETYQVDKSKYFNRPTSLTPDEIVISSDAIWYLQYNGLDGDSWDMNNYHSYIAIKLPRNTPKAEAMVLEIRALDESITVAVAEIKKLESVIAARQFNLNKSLPILLFRKP